MKNNMQKVNNHVLNMVAMHADPADIAFLSYIKKYKNHVNLTVEQVMVINRSAGSGKPQIVPDNMHMINHIQSMDLTKLNSCELFNIFNSSYKS